MKKLVIITTLLSSMMFAQSATAGEAITILGDPCTAPLVKKMGDAFTKKTGTAVNVEIAACAAGIYKASNGLVDIGVSTHEVVLDYLPDGTVNNIIAKAPTVVLVNKANPVNDLKLQQLKDILSGKIKNWKEVGGNDSEIKNVLLQPCTTTIFSKRSAPFGKDITRLTQAGNPVAATNQLVEENEGAMGLQIYGYESPDVKVITVDGYLPDEKSFPSKYQFYQDYNVVTQVNANSNTKAFVDFALSPEGQEIVASLKHIRVKK
ncbi:MAG TPA: substrate-binding domain-containing protein [Gallionella sp.]|jgi:phosphate transport system substrate-binding protein|nr:substrate-binding domain-containing protein [Gallionella sp.]